MHIDLDDQLPEFPLRFKRTEPRGGDVENCEKKNRVGPSDVDCCGVWWKDDDWEPGRHVGQVLIEDCLGNSIVQVCGVVV